LFQYLRFHARITAGPGQLSVFGNYDDGIPLCSIQSLGQVKSAELDAAHRSRRLYKDHGSRLVDPLFSILRECRH
jgi:hypothetical protein